MKWLGGFLVSLLVAMLAIACEEGGEEAATATPSPAVAGTVTPQTTPSPEVTPTPEATPMPRVGDEYEGWLTYTNDVYGYEFRYPPAATVTEASESAFHLSAEEAQEGVTFRDVYERYTGKICIHVDYELGYVNISAPPNRYVICFRTGRAYEGPSREETLLIDGKTYTAQGFEEQGPGETLPYHNEMLRVELDDGTTIEYGPKPVETATFDDYLEIRDDLLKIVQSYRKLP